MKTEKLSICFVNSCILVNFLVPLPTIAQMIPDTTLPNNSSVSTSGNSSTIEGGTRAGNNLFYSFEQFSVPTGSQVYFNNPTDIQNIFTRVTGSGASNIDGLIQTSGSANLFLLNPNGIVFGDNASLNIDGSFVASTANSIDFADGSKFSAQPQQSQPLLSVNVPIGLRFGTNPRSIRVQGDGQGQRITSEPIDTTAGLRVQPNQTLALVGGDLNLEGGTLKTAGGRIELGSVAAPGQVSITPIEKGLALGYQDIAAFGNIQLFNFAAVDVSGLGGGDVQVTGRNLTLSNGGQIVGDTLGASTGGTLNINVSDTLKMEGIPGDADSNSNTQISAETVKEATGNGGNIKLIAKRLILGDEAQITTTINGSGNAGSIDVLASDSVEIVGKSAATGSLFGSAISSAVADEEATGNGGSLNIETGRLILTEGGIISVDTFGQGGAGNLSVKADSIELTGKLPDGFFGSSLSALSQGSGNGGNLSVQTGQLSVTDGARVTVNSESGTGNAGLIQISAKTINLNNDGGITAATSSGRGGNITLDSGQLQLHDSEITATAGNNGDGGNININSDILIGTQGSRITANAYRGTGGNININTEGLFFSPSSRITASSQFGINGTVKFNRIDNNPTNGTIQLPQSPVDATGLIVQGCPGTVPGQSSSFTITGRGGLQPNPFKPLDVEPTPWIDTRSFDSTENRSTQPTSKQNNSSKGKIKFSLEQPVSFVEADSVSLDPQGNVVFFSSAPQRRSLPSLNCELFERIDK